MRTKLLLAAGLAISPAAPLSAETCARHDFEAVVDEAAIALSGLNSSNTPLFQGELRRLRAKRGWDQTTFIREAAAFVRDETIEDYDRQTKTLLDEIANVGQRGTTAGDPDCGLLHSLRQRMDELVAVHTRKWTYMFEKLKKAIEAE